MSDEKPNEYQEVPTRVEFEQLKKSAVELASIVEDLGAILESDEREKVGFTTHYQYMIINCNLMARVMESIIDHMIEREGAHPTAFRIALMERALATSKESKGKWAGPLAEDMEKSEHMTIEVIKMKLESLRASLKAKDSKRTKVSK